MLGSPSERNMSGTVSEAQGNPPAIRGWIIWSIATLFVVYQLTLQTGYGAIEDSVAKSVGASAAASSLLAASFLFAYSIMQLPAGLLLDRGNPRRLLFISVLACALATFAFGQFDTYPALLASRACMGAAAAFAFPGAGLVARRWVRPSQFALAMGLVDVSFGAGAVFGNAGLEALLQSMDWQELMTWLAIGGGVLAVLIALFIRSAPRGSDLVQAAERIHLFQACRTLLGARQVRLAMIFYAGMCGTIFGLYGFWDIKLQQAFGFTPADSIRLNSWLFVGLGVGALVSGIIADWWRRRKPLLVIGSLGGCFAVAFVLFAPADSYIEALLGLLINGLLLGVSVLIFPSVCESLPKGYSAAAIGIVNAAGCFAGGVLQFIPGLFMDGTKVQELEVYQRTLVLYLIVMIASTVAAFMLHETRPGWDNAVTPTNENLDPEPEPEPEPEPGPTT